MRVLCIISVLLILSVSSPGQSPGVIFTDITKKAGIDFVYTFGDKSYFNILESSGSGVTVFDYNNDGLMDILFLNGTYLEGISDPEGKSNRKSSNRLYRNNGNGKFSDITQEAGLGGARWSMAASPVDIDSDGDMDLFLLNYGANIFYLNNGDGTFSDITAKTGLAGPEKLNGFTKWSIGAAFWDYNNDGRLDVMVGNFLAFDPMYVSPQSPKMMPHPSEYKGQASMLYEQLPDGSFIDVSEKAGLLYPDSKCMGLTVFDYDDDGDLDIFQANDHQFNFLFRNRAGSFREIGVQSGVAANTKGIGSGSMHGSIGDIDNDGLTDIFVSDLEYSALYKNLGNGLFRDVIETSGLAGFLSGKGTWGSTFIDFDNDGDQDIIAANGTAEELILQYPLLLENDGKGMFRNSSFSHGDYFKTKRSGRGLAVCDFDNDGDRDVIISHVDLQGTPVLLRNDGGNNGNWIGIDLIGAKGRSFAAGAKIVITAGMKSQTIVNQWSNSYLSSNDPRVFAGIGNAKIVEKLEITWPGGRKEFYDNIPANRYITIKEGEGILRK